VHVPGQPAGEDDEVEGDREERRCAPDVDQLHRGEHVQREEHAQQDDHDQRDSADVEPAGHERDRDHHEQDQIGGSGLDANRGQEEDAEPDGEVVAGEGERERADEPDPEGEDQRQREWMLRESDSGGDCEQEQPGGACEPAALRAANPVGPRPAAECAALTLLYAPRHAGRDPASTSPAGDHPGRGRRRPVVCGRAPPALAERYDVVLAAYGEGPLIEEAARAGARFVPLQHVRGRSIRCAISPAWSS
jgi:hypothetical protein